MTVKKILCHDHRIILYIIILSVLVSSARADLPESERAYLNKDEKTLKRLASEQGDAKAQFRLGEMYENGEGVEKDYREAVKWYTKAAQQGLASAQNNLGGMYRNGYGVVQRLS